MGNLTARQKAEIRRGAWCNTANVVPAHLNPGKGEPVRFGLPLPLHTQLCKEKQCAVPDLAQLLRILP